MAVPRDTDERRSKRHAQAGGLVCEFWVGDARHTGTVKDVSSGGLFIQTPATVAPGTTITLVLAPTLDQPEVRFSARVVRSDQLRPDLHGVPGIGIEVLQPGALEQVMGDLGRLERAGDTLDGSKKRSQ